MTLVPFDDRDGFIWFNGTLRPWREAQIHVVTHGLHYGSAVFEGERAYGGKIFKSRDHSIRFHTSAEMIGMKIPYSIDQLETAKYETLRANHLTDAYIRPIAWRGSEQMGIAAQNTKTHVAIAVWEWPSYFAPEIAARGISLALSRWKKPAPDMAPIQSKASGLYIINTLAKHEAEQRGFHDALMLDYRGYAVETTGANLFRIKDGILRTPAADCFLNGITRLTIIDLARSLGYKVEEDHITLDDLMNSDEVFITGTAAEVTAIGKIEDTVFAVGPITRKIQESYTELVRQS
jgi:branched-chain amino acid aminotransferase